MTGKVKWFNTKKDMDLSQMKMKKMYLYIILQLIWKDIKLLQMV